MATNSPFNNRFNRTNNIWQTFSSPNISIPAVDFSKLNAPEKIPEDQLGRVQFKHLAKGEVCFKQKNGQSLIKVDFNMACREDKSNVKVPVSPNDWIYRE